MHAQFIHYLHRFGSCAVRRFMVGYQIDRSYTNTRLLCGLILLWGLLTSGCSHWQAVVERDQLQQRVIQGAMFKHRLFWNAAAQAALKQPAASPRTWHVYIEGDGHAVDVFGQPTANPTPPVPILLPALAVDQSPALYLGRPCYFDIQDEQCHPARWTLERYSAATVESLQAAATAFIPPQDAIILLGHSGGGTLAMLLAARLPRTCAVITLAGNLDVKAWLKANDFTPLPDSLDPAAQPPLPPRIHQWHFAGTDDKVILPGWIAAASARQPHARFEALPDTDHITPWQDHLLNSLKSLQNQPSGTSGAAPLKQALDNSQSVCGKVTESPLNKGL